MCGNQWFFFFFWILLFPVPFFISQSITAQGSRNLFRLNIVWNVKTSMHILTIKLIPFYEDATHLDIFASECEETDLGVCALPIFKGKRRERRRSECQEEGWLLQMCPLTPFPAPRQRTGEYAQGDLPLPVRPEMFLVLRLLWMTCLGKHAAKPERDRGGKKESWADSRAPSAGLLSSLG